MTRKFLRGAPEKEFRMRIRAGNTAMLFKTLLFGRPFIVASLHVDWVTSTGMERSGDALQPSQHNTTAERRHHTNGLLFNIV